MKPSTLPHLLAIIGPTAVGKSALALQLSVAIGGEIITADSRQVYRYMDIGTDKPGPQERALAPHHMLDLVDPDETFTAALYQEVALAVIPEVLERGRVPVLAGGTPLYVSAVLEGWTIPRVEPDPELRATLELRAKHGGSGMLHEELRRLDPKAASAILPSNTRRIIRALEVTILTGRPISDQQDKAPPPYRTLTIGLSCDRKGLYRRIDARVDAQMQRGLVDEVEELRARGYSYDLPSMSGLGYRQIGHYLRGLSTVEEAVQRIKYDTHAFARHQSNWFRRMHDVVWIDPTTGDSLEAALRLTDTFIKG